MTSVPAETQPLKLLAEDSDDLAVVSAHVQDAIVPIADIAYLDGDRQFVMALNRFMWEAGKADGLRPDGDTAPDPGDGQDGTVYLRTHSGLLFENVESVQTREIDLKARGTMLSLLAVRDVDGGIELDFSGNATIRLVVSGIRCRLTDFGDPWPTSRLPTHSFEDDTLTP